MMALQEAKGSLLLLETAFGCFADLVLRFGVLVTLKILCDDLECLGTHSKVGQVVEISFECWVRTVVNCESLRVVY